MSQYQLGTKYQKLYCDLKLLKKQEQRYSMTIVNKADSTEKGFMKKLWGTYKKT